MLPALSGSLLATLTFAVMGGMLLGLGLGVRRLYGLRTLTPDDAMLAPWVGYAATVLVLLCWNFRFAVDTRAFVLLAALGVAGLTANRRALRALLADHGTRVRWQRGVLVLVALWLGNRALGPMTNWDSSLYHMQGARWAAEHPAIPGIANLFGPLAFNNASLLFGALWDVGPWEGRAWHVANAGLVTIWILTALLAGFRLVRRDGAPRPADLFTFLTLTLGVSVVASDSYASYVPDVALHLTRVAMIATWFRLLTAPRREGRAEAYDLVALVFIAAVGVAIKMNAAIFASLVVGTAAALWLRRPADAPRVQSQAVAWALVIGIGYGVAWTGRGVVLSGYPVFPSQVLAAPVPWRAPAEHAQAEFDYVVHSTRLTSGNYDYVAGRVQGYAAWVPHWAANVLKSPFDVVVPLALTLAVLPFLFLPAPPGPRDRGASREAWWIMLPACVAVVAWFVVAPAPRYLTAIFWTFPLLYAAQAYARHQAWAEPRWNRRIFAAGLALGFAPMILAPLDEWAADPGRGNPLRGLAHALVVVPPPGELMESAGQGATTHEFTTRSGIVLHVPDSRCWDLPLPCTPNPAPNLRLRDPDNLERGFVVAGEWEMQDWPEPWKARYKQAWDQSQALAHP